MPTPNTTKTAPVSEKAVRAWLRRLGGRRRRAAVESREIRTEMTKALRAAHGVIEIKEAAELLGIHRTAAYRTYHAGTNRKT